MHHQLQTLDSPSVITFSTKRPRMLVPRSFIAQNAPTESCRCTTRIPWYHQNPAYAHRILFPLTAWTWSSGVIYFSSVCSTAQLALHHGSRNSLTQVQTSICWYFLTPEVICASISISVYKYTCFLSPKCTVCHRIGVSSLYYHQSTATGDPGLVI